MTLQAQNFAVFQKAAVERPEPIFPEEAATCHFVIGAHAFVAVASIDDEDGDGRQLVGRISLGGVEYLVYDAAPPPPEAPPAAEILTRRELQIAMLIGDGKCDKEIALQLGISGYTVREHIRRIFAKLNIGRRAAIVSYIMRQAGASLF